MRNGKLWKLQQGTETVSYTHLDVYKRQHFAAGCGGVDAGGGAADQNVARPAGGYQ